jgi:phosphatidylglycerophosphate synthase
VGVPVGDPGTAVRDSAVAVAAAVVLCAGLAAYGNGLAAALAGAAAVTGITVVASAGSAVMSRANRWSGPADRVTLVRTVLIGGCATLAVLVLADALPARPWWLVVLVVPALALDFVDGLVARRTGTSSDAGARLDMEMDAALLLVLSVVATQSLGRWVLAVGLMRYLFVAASWVRPRLTGKLEFSSFRRVVAAVQGITLAAALAPVFPLAVSRSAVAVSLGLLVVSFARDVVWLERGNAERTAAPGVAAGTAAATSGTGPAAAV